MLLYMDLSGVKSTCLASILAMKVKFIAMGMRFFYPGLFYKGLGFRACRAGSEVYVLVAVIGVVSSVESLIVELCEVVIAFFVPV